MTVHRLLTVLLLTAFLHAPVRAADSCEGRMPGTPTDPGALSATLRGMLPPLMAGRLEPSLAVRPGGPGTADAVPCRVAGSLRYRFAAGTLDLGRVDGLLRFDATDGRFSGRLDVEDAIAAGVPALGLLAGRLDLPGLFARPYRGQVAFDLSTATGEVRFTLRANPWSVSGIVRIAGERAAGEIDVAWRDRVLPAGARFPRLLERTLSRRGAAFRFDFAPRRDGAPDRFRFELPDEDDALRLVADAFPDEGRFPVGLAAGSLDPALRRAAALLGGGAAFGDTVPVGLATRAKARFHLGLVDDLRPADLDPLDPAVRLDFVRDLLHLLAEKPERAERRALRRAFTGLHAGDLVRLLERTPGRTLSAGPADRARRAELVAAARRFVREDDAADRLLDPGDRRRLERLSAGLSAPPGDDR